jgi:glycosyltransferase involved in cell wall biosynthesis
LIPSRWKKYFSLPGNFGLATAGSFLSASVAATVERLNHESRIDMIHAHGALPCGYAAMLLSQRLSVPYIVTVHGLDVYSGRQVTRFAGNRCKRVSENIYREAKAVVCVSGKVQEQLAGQGINSVVVHNGVDTDLFRPLRKSAEQSTILSVGNLIPTKGHSLLIRAFAHVARTVPECILEIIGDGTERKKLESLANTLGLPARVVFRGRQGRSQTAEAMRRCTVFVLPSRYEGFGCVYVEAMACGKPAIGCKGQGIDEIIEHGVNGFLTPADSEADLSSLMQTLLQSPALCDCIGMAARETILEGHTLQHQAARLADVYRKCLR